jgi:hypothetical protein
MAKGFRRKAIIKSEKMRTFAADIADAKILCNKVVSMSGKVGFELQYKIKLTTLFLQISLKNGTHINLSTRVFLFLITLF